VQFVAMARVELGGPPCISAAPCPLVFIDLDGDSIPEAIAFWNGSPHMFKRTGELWSPVSLVRGNRCNRCNDAQLVRELKAGHFKIVDPKWKNLQVGDETFIVTEGGK
jgi:hypothetical protein